MSWLSFKNTSLGAQTVVVFDITSATVGCSVVELKKGEKPLIHFTTRIPLKFQTHFRYDRFVQEMFKAFNIASGEARHFIASSSTVKKTDHVSCVLSSAWHISKTHFLSFNRDQPFTVSKQLVDKMIERTEDHVEHEESTARKQKHIDDLTVIEKKLLSIALNGYTTTEPFGKPAKTIDASLYISFISSPIYKKIKEALEAQFSDNEITFHSHALSAYTVVRDCYSAKDNFLLLDIDGEVSDISIVKDDILQGSVSIPIGVNTIARSLNKKQKGATEEGRSLMRMIAEGKETLDKESKERILLDEAGREWKDAITQALVKLSDTDLYPQNIFLTAPEDSALWFKNLMEEPPKNDDEGEAEKGTKFSVTILSSQLLHDLLTFDKGVSPDPPISLHSIHVSRIS